MNGSKLSMYAVLSALVLLLSCSRNQKLIEENDKLIETNKRLLEIDQRLRSELKTLIPPFKLDGGSHVRVVGGSITFWSDYPWSAGATANSWQTNATVTNITLECVYTNQVGSAPACNTIGPTSLGSDWHVEVLASNLPWAPSGSGIEVSPGKGIILISPLGDGGFSNSDAATSGERYAGKVYQNTQCKSSFFCNDLDSVTVHLSRADTTGTTYVCFGGYCEVLFN